MDTGRAPLFSYINYFVLSNMVIYPFNNLNDFINFL